MAEVGVLALGLGLAGAAMSTSSKVNAANAVGKYSEVEAKSIESEAAYSERQSRRWNKLAQGEANAQAAASGVSISSGSPLFLELDRAKQAELDAQHIRHSGQVAATSKRFEGQLAKKQIPGIIMGGVGQGATALGSFLSRS